MQIQQINSRETWDKFINSQSPNTFMQSWAWGEFNARMGHKIFRLGLFDTDKLVGIALVLKIVARRGSFLYIPNGPLFIHEPKEFRISNFEFLTKYLSKLAEDENCSFVRIAPLMLNTEENRKVFVEIGFRKAPIHMQAELMWLLDITPDETTILKNMRKTTRYEIRKAEKEGVTVEASNNIEDLDKFISVYRSTVDRQNFVPFSEKYLKNELESFAPNNASLFFAKYKAPSESATSPEEDNGEILATALIVFTESEAFYHQGASNQKYPKIPAAYLLQWEIIREAKRRGCRIYNFWGISPDENKNHPWHGLSLFKKGFGGYSEEYLPAQDLIINKKYWFNWIVEKARKIKRGF